LSGDGAADFPLFHHCLVMEQLISCCSITKIHKIHVQQNPGACFSEVAEAPQAAATQTHPAGSFWKWFWGMMEQPFPRCSIIV